VPRVTRNRWLIRPGHRKHQPGLTSGYKRFPLPSPVRPHNNSKIPGVQLRDGRSGNRFIIFFSLCRQPPVSNTLILFLFIKELIVGDSGGGRHKDRKKIMYQLISRVAVFFSSIITSLVIDDDGLWKEKKWAER
jgi:hypothetical protein